MTLSYPQQSEPENMEVTLKHPLKKCEELLCIIAGRGQFHHPFVFGGKGCFLNFQGAAALFKNIIFRIHDKKL